MTSRWILVDDLDKRIEYVGAWVQKSVQEFAQWDNFGPPFGSTVHAVSSGNAGFSFRFNGSNGAVLGTSTSSDIGALIDPQWECFIDGTKIPSANATLTLRNNQKFCEWTNTPAGEHTLTVNVTSAQYPFHFDQIRYAPSSDSQNPNTRDVVSLSYNDRIFNFESSWREVHSMGMMTAVKGATTTFAFSGSSISLYGTGLTSYPHAPSNATYQLDGGDPVAFTLSDLGPAGITVSRFNEVLFEVQNLQQGQHTMSVTYEGDSSVRPLILSSIVVQNYYEEVVSTSKKSLPISAIIGGVLGGFFLILTIIFLIFWYRFRRKRAYQHVDLKEGRREIDPFYVDVSTYKVPSPRELSGEFEPLTRMSRSSSMVGLDKHLVDPFAIPDQSSTPPRRPHPRYSRPPERIAPSRTSSFEILLSAPPPNVRSSGIVAVRLRSDSVS
ncbi:hypothetical protein CVT24_004187 [Panaeolus cyanescens]|uniref:Uncharacterized protein n=1 Tax=Panaeolus cyanescens TaxID=181874 RepID=A0A409W7S3_9AGAR|nr:hypothetical protein CVT24_004187 [Panaeolus cyanescens]